MNTFGRLFRVSIFGESHGKGVGVMIDGCPPGIAITETEMLADLDRRRAGKPGTTPRKEHDIPEIVAGVHKGYTTGAPIVIMTANSNKISSDYEKLRGIPRPGHADFTGMVKYGGFADDRGGGHFSGRLTWGLVAAGTLARKIIAPAEVSAVLSEAGGSSDIDAAVAKAVESGDSIGGIIRCSVQNLRAGIGEPYFMPVEAHIAQAVFSIPAIKGIEFGAGFAAAGMTGSQHNDIITDSSGKTATNNAGGINGGITNGNELYFRVVVKPTSSIAKPQESINLNTNSITKLEIGGRHDVCIALRIPVIVEAATAIALADLTLTDRGIFGERKKND